MARKSILKCQLEDQGFSEQEIRWGTFIIGGHTIGGVPIAASRQEVAAAVGGTTPKGPFGHPFHGPFAGPIG